MSKKIQVAGSEYDSRSVVEAPEKLHLPNHPKVYAFAIPVRMGKELSGKMKVIVKIPFGKLELNTKEIVIDVHSPRRIDAINKVIEVVKTIPTYRRVTAKA